MWNDFMQIDSGQLNAIQKEMLRFGASFAGLGDHVHIAERGASVIR